MIFAFNWERALNNFTSFMEGVETFLNVLVVIFSVITILGILLVAGIVVVVIALLITLIINKRRAANAPPELQKQQQPTKEELKPVYQETMPADIPWDEISAIQVITLDRKQTQHWVFLALQNEVLGQKIMIPHLDPRAKSIFDTACH
jgi:hypothetical protein